MSNPNAAQDPVQVPSPDDEQSALFAHLIMQQANMAMMLLGKMAHPETGKTVKDIDAARFFIDVLEMLEAKTRGNLSKEEAAVLKQTLMSLRLSFVEAVESGPAPAAAKSPDPSATPEPASTPAAGGGPPPAAAASTPAEEDEHRKKFTKKY